MATIGRKREDAFGQELLQESSDPETVADDVFGDVQSNLSLPTPVPFLVCYLRILNQGALRLGVVCSAPLKSHSYPHYCRGVDQSQCKKAGQQENARQQTNSFIFLEGDPADHEQSTNCKVEGYQSLQL